MFKLSKKHKRWWEFLITMVEREIKSKYKTSVVGLFWVAIGPIFQMVVIGFIFKFFTSLKTEDYLFYLFSGLLVWNFFSSSVTRATPSIISERFLIKKAIFPRETIIISIVLLNLIQMLLSIILMILVAFLIGFDLSNINLILLILSVVLLFSFVLGFSFISSSLNVKYRDTNFIINFLMSIWFYATPIIYTLDVLPKNISFWLYLNPLTSLLEFFRLSIFGWKNNINLILIGLASSLLFLFFGFFLFKKKSLNFDDWL